MERKVYYNKDDVERILNVKRVKAYEIIKKLNIELEEKGFITIPGQVPIKYFKERFYI